MNTYSDLGSLLPQLEITITTDSILIWTFFTTVHELCVFCSIAILYVFNYDTHPEFDIDLLVHLKKSQKWHYLYGLYYLSLYCHLK